MDIEKLELIGLTKNESITYTTLLKIGDSKSGKLLKESGLNSGKIYEILDSLKKKGLVSESSINGTKHFNAAPPSQLKYYHEQRKKELEKKEKQIDKLIPELEEIRKALLPEKRILTYTGFQGIITAAEEALEQTKEKEEILSLGISDVNAWSQKYWIKWEKLRQKKKISARYILSEKGKIYTDLKKEKHIEVKVIKTDTPVGIDIYGKDKALILHYQEPISVTFIQDENTARTLRSYFEVLWKTAR